MNDATRDHDRGAATSHRPIPVPLNKHQPCFFDECYGRKDDPVKNI